MTYTIAQDGYSRGPETPEELAAELLLIQQGSRTEAILMAQDIPDDDLRSEVIILLES